MRFGSELVEDEAECADEGSSDEESEEVDDASQCSGLFDDDEQQLSQDSDGRGHAALDNNLASPNVQLYGSD